MLAQILPGFRDFRVPLITGFLWLVALWIAFGMPVPSGQETEGPIGALNRLGSYLAPSVNLVVLGFLGYVLGVLLMPSVRSSHRLGAWVINKSRQLIGNASDTKLGQRLIPKKIRAAAVAWQDIDANGLTVSQRDQIEELAMNVLYTAGKSQVDLTPLAHHYDWLSPEEYGQRDDDDSHMLKLLNKDLHRELLSISAPLQAANEKLFNAYDRARSEAEFRFSIHWPVVAIAAATIWINWGASLWVQSIVGAAGVLIGFSLLFKGVAKMNEAMDIAVEAIKAEVVTTKTLERIKALEVPGRHAEQ